MEGTADTSPAQWLKGSTVAGTAPTDAQAHARGKESKMGTLKSWSCKGCTNVCYRLTKGEVAEYCKPTLEGRVRHEWVTDEFIDCLDKTTDPKATDNTIKIYGV